MAKAKDAKKDLTPTTLVTTAVLSPYRANEVFTVPKYAADMLMEEGHEDEDGNVRPVKVRLWDRNDPADVALLEANMGKSLAELEAKEAPAEDAKAAKA